jgi:hypothetical protein
MNTKRISIFFVFILLIIFETLSGERTNSFIYILFIYLISTKINRKSYIIYIVLIFAILLTGVLLTRAKGVTGNQDEGLSISIIGGEFTNTFVTLPYILSRNLLTQGFTIQRVLIQFVEGFLPGFIRASLDQSIGGELAEHIGRGYGLANNFITELFYLYGIAGIFIIPVYFLIFYYMDKQLSSDEHFIFKIISIFQVRLFVREGFVALTTIIYIIMIYSLIPYLFSKKNTDIKNVFIIKY